MTHGQDVKSILTRHGEIRAWVSRRRGLPAIARTHDDRGEPLARLCLSFERRRCTPGTRARGDDGMSPVSWSAWLAELDRQHLALRVGEGEAPDFEFVRRDPGPAGEPDASSAMR